MNSKKVAGYKGFVVRQRPKEYSQNKPQEVLTKISKQCGVKKGISKAELQKLMKECIGPAMKKYWGRNDRR